MAAEKSYRGLVAAKQQVVYMLYTEGQFVGDRSQALGVKQAITDRLGKESRVSVAATEYDDTHGLESLKAQIAASNDKAIIIGAGSNGLKDLVELKNDPALKDKVFAVWSGHMVFPGLAEAAHQLDVIALPAHVLSHEVKAALQGAPLLVPTVGVPHNLTPGLLQQERITWETKNDLLPAAEKYIGVFLGGDAPDVDGKTQKFFTQGEAVALAEYIAEKAKAEGALVLATNGPRTGKFDPLTGEEQKNAHRDGKIDPVSQAFLAQLEAAGVANDFYDFQFSNLPSAYKAILHVLSTMPGSNAIVTGESTSMVSEIGDMLPRGAMMIAEIGSMNVAHQAHVDSCYQAGIASGVKVTETGAKEISVEIQKSEPLSAAQTIAKQVCQVFQAQNAARSL